MPEFQGTFGLVDEFVYGRAFQQLFPLGTVAGNVVVPYNVGGEYIERVAAVSFLLTAVGGAGLRRGLVEFLDQGGVVFAAASSPFTVAAGSSSQLTFNINTNDGGAVNAPAIVGVLPAVFLQPTYSVAISVVNGLVADTIANVRLLSDRFRTGPSDFPPGQGEPEHPHVRRHRVPVG
jgi:hypothetical protein